MTDVVVVIGWRDRGDPDRQANLETVLNHLGEITDWPTVVVGDGLADPSPFNRSRAYNRAIAANPAEVWVFHEADMLMPPGALQAAVSQATDWLGLVVPFTTYRYLSSEDTVAVRADPSQAFKAEAVREMLNGRATGAVNVVSRDTMKAVGQWDEVFSGWGYDDRAMTRAFAIAVRRPTRYVKGPGVHLWHTPGWPAGGRFAGGAPRVPQLDAAATAANRRRYETLYIPARTPQRIREITAGALT